MSLPKQPWSNRPYEALNDDNSSLSEEEEPPPEFCIISRHPFDVLSEEALWDGGSTNGATSYIGFIDLTIVLMSLS